MSKLAYLSLQQFLKLCRTRDLSIVTGKLCPKISPWLSDDTIDTVFCWSILTITIILWFFFLLALGIARAHGSAFSGACVHLASSSGGVGFPALGSRRLIRGPAQLGLGPQAFLSIQTVSPATAHFWHRPNSRMSSSRLLIRALLILWLNLNGFSSLLILAVFSWWEKNHFIDFISS